MAHIHSAAQSFIGTVFAAPNLLRYPLLTGAAPTPATKAVQAASPVIGAWLKGAREWPLLLPRADAGEEGMTWYACAYNEAHLRGLLAEMRAFIGPTYAHFPSLRATLDPGDLIEFAIDREFEGRVLKIVVPEGYCEKVSRQIETYVGLLMKRPSIAAHTVASFTQLRARFDLALLAGNEAAAQEWLNALASRNLSAENRHFLKIRFYAALGQWSKIVEYPLLPTLINLKLPPETYSDIFEALYTTLLHKAEESQDLEELLKRFDARLFQAYPSLFRTRRHSTRAAVLKGAICRELSLAAPDPQQCLTLLSQLPSGAFPAEIERQIRERCKKLQAPDPAVAALEALNMEEFERAFELYLGLPPTLEVGCALLRCAREIDDVGDAQKVLALLDKEGLRDEAAIRSPRMYKHVVELAASEASTPQARAQRTAVEQLGWLQSDGETAEQYVARWREGASSWDPADILSEINCGPKAAAIVEALSIDAPEVFEQVFPLWYRLFVDRVEVPDTRLIPVYLALLATMRVRAAYGDDELTLIKRAAACVLECGAGATVYAAMVDDLHAVLEENRSAYLIDWAIDLADQMLLAACPSAEARLRFLTNVVSLSSQFARRLTPLQIKLTERVAAESELHFSAELAQPRAGEGTPALDVQGRVAIYTLDSGTAQRARAMLMQSYPGLRVDLNHDEVCTTELRNLAKQVDWFVFAWRCATHQAWFCVKASVGDTAKLCWAKGNGAASLAQVVEQKMLMPSDAIDLEAGR
jgi:hypothetical protein